ncbi:toxin-antitoxin system toxin RelE/ParE family protein (plasmid) [Rhizobium sp. NXC14]|nr:toxin-antitoxin system toxin RelE/ParE family protein [Rhizobium sp. NXC14]
MKLTWSAFALSDRDAIFTYIEADNPLAAIMIDERIVAATRRLVDFPASGRNGRIAGTRELVINGTPYIAAYAVTATVVRVLRVLHGLAGMARHFAQHLSLHATRIRYV